MQTQPNVQRARKRAERSRSPSLGDLAPDSDPETPWYRALQGRDLSLASVPRTPAGRALTNVTLRVAESLRVVPEGTTQVSTLLNVAADALVDGGKSGVFTPMYFFLVRKPVSA